MAERKVDVNCRYDRLKWIFTPRWRKTILRRRKPKHEKSMVNVYVKNLNFNLYGYVIYFILSGVKPCHM